MKKSVYEAARRSYWLRMQQESLDAYPRAMARAAEDVAAVEAAGFAWDPEDKDWPELAADEGEGLRRKAPGGLRIIAEEQAERIARAWNARRPGGEMEKRLREVIDAYTGASRPFAAVADAIAAALRLGVEE